MKILAMLLGMSLASMSYASIDGCAKLHGKYDSCTSEQGVDDVEFNYVSSSSPSYIQYYKNGELAWSVQPVSDDFECTANGAIFSPNYDGLDMTVTMTREGNDVVIKTEAEAIGFSETTTCTVSE